MGVYGDDMLRGLTGRMLRGKPIEARRRQATPGPEGEVIAIGFGSEVAFGGGLSELFPEDDRERRLGCWCSMPQCAT
jgi:hypothetical protein